MDQQEFSRRFQKSLNDAVDLAEKINGKQYPRDLEIELHGAGFSGDRMSVADAAEFLYISEDQFWRVIDVAVRSATESETVIFVRASGHPPTSWENTWFGSDERGPFKVLGPGIDGSV